MASSVRPCDLVSPVSKAPSSAALLCCVIVYNYLLPLLAVSSWNWTWQIVDLLIEFLLLKESYGESSHKILNLYLHTYSNTYLPENNSPRELKHFEEVTELSQSKYSSSQQTVYKGPEWASVLGFCGVAWCLSQLLTVSQSHCSKRVTIEHM